MIHWNAFASRQELAENLAQRVADTLREAISQRGQATLALSGGSTPKRFLSCLSKIDLPWADINITLADDRWVAASSERSNILFLDTYLMKNDKGEPSPASQARLWPLIANATIPPEHIDSHTFDAVLDGLPFPIDATILGMGNDGHTASLFPNGNNLAKALSPETTHKLMPMTADGAPEPRVTMTLPCLLSSRHLFLHIEGDEKKNVYEQALTQASVLDKPIKAILAQTKRDVHVYWAS